MITTIMRLVMACLVLLPSQSLGQPTADKDPNTIYLGQYKLKFRDIKPHRRIRLTELMKCIPEFDYVYLGDYIAESSSTCESRLDTLSKDKDTSCGATKTLIRTRCAETETDLKNQLNTMTLKYNGAVEANEALANSHNLELRKHYVIGAALSVALLSVVTVVIAK